MFNLDYLTFYGLVAALGVVAVVYTLCKLRGCNKPIC